MAQIPIQEGDRIFISDESPSSISAVSNDADIAGWIVDVTNARIRALIAPTYETGVALVSTGGGVINVQYQGTINAIFGKLASDTFGAWLGVGGFGGSSYAGSKVTIESSGLVVSASGGISTSSGGTIDIGNLVLNHVSVNDDVYLEAFTNPYYSTIDGEDGIKVRFAAGEHGTFQIDSASGKKARLILNSGTNTEIWKVESLNTSSRLTFGWYRVTTDDWYYPVTFTSDGDIIHVGSTYMNYDKAINFGDNDDFYIKSIDGIYVDIGISGGSPALRVDGNADVTIVNNISILGEVSIIDGTLSGLTLNQYDIQSTNYTNGGFIIDTIDGSEAQLAVWDNGSANTFLGWLEENPAVYGYGLWTNKGFLGGTTVETSTVVVTSAGLVVRGLSGINLTTGTLTTLNSRLTLSDNKKYAVDLSNGGQLRINNINERLTDISTSYISIYTAIDTAPSTADISGTSLSIQTQFVNTSQTSGHRIFIAGKCSNVVAGISIDAVQNYDNNAVGIYILDNITSFGTGIGYAILSLSTRESNFYGHIRIQPTKALILNETTVANVPAASVSLKGAIMYDNTNGWIGCDGSAWVSFTTAVIP